MLLYTRLAPPKAPKRRSRAGCTSCKEKKKKCDEERPQCNRCAERGLECSYEPVKPRQRRKRESTAPNPRPATSQLTTSRTSYPPDRTLSEDSDDSQGTASYSRWGYTGQSHQDALEATIDTTDFTALSPLESSYGVSPLMNASFPGGPGSDLSALSQTNHSLACGFPYNQGDDTETPEAESATAGPRRRRRESASTTSTVVVNSPLATKSLYPDLAMISPFPPGSPLLEFHVPAFSEFSESPQRRALVAHFCNVLSHLIVFREESGNPFQQLVLPLTKGSSPVLNAIYALASAHLEYRCSDGGEKSLYFHNKAIQGLAGLIEQDDMTSRNELLATIMLLVYYEVLVQRGRSNIVDGHLKGALTIMCTDPGRSDDPTATFLERAFRFYDVIAALSNGTAPLSAAPAAGCLQPFPPMGAPMGSPLSNVDTLLGMATTLWPIIHRLSSLPSLKAELEDAMQVEPTSCKVAVLRTELENTTDAIEAALNRWQPILPPDFSLDELAPEDVEAADCTAGTSTASTSSSSSCSSSSTGPHSPSSRRSASSPFASTDDPPNRNGLHSILHNALAYRHSALVYLYRTIHGLDRMHAAVQRHAHTSLVNCEATVRAGGPMGALLWPLFVAACEAASDPDRELARRAFEGVEKRQGMLNIGRAWEIVGEVWRRADQEAGLGGDRSGVRGMLVGDLDGHVDEIARGAQEGTKNQRGACSTPSKGYQRGPGVGNGSWRKPSKGADLWRRVSADLGVHVVFG